MLKIFHARLQHYVNQEFPDTQAGFRKGRGTRIQIVNVRWIIDWSEVKVAQLCSTLCDPMDHTVHGILQARITGVGSHSLLQGIFPTQGPNPGLPGFFEGSLFTSWATREAQIIEKAREFQKNIYLCFIHYIKTFDIVDHKKLWKALKEMGISDHLTCLLRNLYVGQEATARTLYGTTAWFRIEKGALQGCLLSPCLTQMLSTSGEMPVWMSYNLELR